MDTGPMNPANWSYKKRLNPKKQPFSILASVLTAPLNQIVTVSSSFSHPRILLDNWPKRQPLSGTKVDIGRSIHRKDVSYKFLTRALFALAAKPAADIKNRLGGLLLPPGTNIRSVFLSLGLLVKSQPIRSLLVGVSRGLKAHSTRAGV